MVNIESLKKKRLEKFLKKCRVKCGSKKVFTNSFLLACSHLNKGIIKDPIRSSFDNELIAALISQGVLNLDNSNEGPPIEIAVEGKLLDYEWVNMTKKNFPTEIEDAVHARVVVRSSTQKNIIITIYAWPCEKDLDLKEIDRNVW